MSSYSVLFVCMWRVFSWKWMKLQKITAGLPSKRDLYLHPAPLSHPLAPTEHGSLLCGLPSGSVPNRLTVAVKTTALGCSQVPHLSSLRNCSVPVSHPEAWALSPALSWHPHGHRAMWSNRGTWGNWSATTDNILSWEQEVILDQADSSGTRASRSSLQWRSLLVKLRCLARVNKGWSKYSLTWFYLWWCLNI